MNVVCESAKTCGILSHSNKIGKKEAIVYSCHHATEHEQDWRCKNTYCARIAPNDSKCIAVTPVTEESITKTE